MLKVAVVGVGGISGAHIPAWQKREDVQLVALCDIRPEQMDKYEGVNKYTDYEEMLEKESVDILDICLPTYLHADVAVAALKKKIHVICEKPVSLHKEDVKRIYDTAKDNGVYFMVAQVLRFWNEYVKLKEIYDSGELGKLLAGYMCRLSIRPKWSWDNWMFDEERSGLVPYDLHIHDLDFMVYMLGTPKNVISHCVNQPDQNYLNVVYEYEDFAITAESSWYAVDFPFEAGFRFLFEKGMVIFEKGGFTIYKNGGIIQRADDKMDEESHVINLPQTDAYATEINYFVDCVKGSREPNIVKPKELEDVIDILNGIKR